MLETIEETLRQLRVAMESHRRSLAAEGAPLPPGPSPVPSGRLAEVYAEIERTAGVHVSATVAVKLEKLFVASDTAALAEWVRRIRRPGPMHPDLQLLIESLTTHETFLFRDKGQLELLRTDILPALIARARTTGERRLRLWSAGCSSGEEAYSLAVVVLAALADAGEAIAANGRVTPLPDWRIEVLGTDISGRAIDAATAGVYGTTGLSSFRAVPPELLHYFPPGEADATRRVCAELRRIVRFQRLNLMDIAPPLVECDVVACRNVLIYLTDAATRHVHELVHRALMPGGALLLGPADSLLEPARYRSHATNRGVIHCRLGSP
ncbi:MAG: methyltransferase [Proteobacteria bacterium]|nr:methyltransferase [Pseudomonadota bacterium]MBI3499830.1 methyltransferase [Pseudomonadota bacterium]